jgi:hypothetical protein
MMNQAEVKDLNVRLAAFIAYNDIDDRVQGVRSELLIKRRSVCGTARDSVLARRIAADRRIGVKDGRVRE